MLSPLFFFLPLSWLNELFLLHVPNHWCYHPSQDQLNASQIEDWKNCFLPKEISPDGILAPSNCKILIPNEFADYEHLFWNSSSLWLERSDPYCPAASADNNESAIVVTCKLGWAFDQSEFSRTVATDNEWVCQNQDYIPQMFTWGVVGSILVRLS